MLRRSRFALSTLACLAALAALAAPAPVAAELDSNTFGGLAARPIGPAVMGGRISDIAAVPGEPLTIYVATASGGLWKSKDGGVTFDPIFEEHAQSVGAVAVDPKDPKVIWAGTGEPWTRNSVSVGTGLYKSTDGGEKWSRVGLEDSERIMKVLIHPEETDTVWVCVPGHLWNDHEQRGVFKTTDGGETWKHVLAIDEKTGCSDIDLDPGDPSILYAGMWQFRRQPWTFSSGGPGSGLYKSADGGETWKELTEGLPKGDKGRIAVAVAPSRPNVVYSLVEAADTTAIYRSNDLGATWEQLNSSFNVKARPFYFARIVVDPTNHERVYKPGLTLAVSHDGGRSFSSPFTSGFDIGTVHPDHHALWIDPRNPQRMLLGTDGGLYESQDRAGHWRHVNNLPVSQLYRIAVDDEYPFRVYAGLQDNGSWRGPSQSPGGVTNGDWEEVGYGDGFWTFPDPEDPDLVYSEMQGGGLFRVRPSTNELKIVTPFPNEGEEKYRFNWNTPFLFGPSGRLYVGAQYLLRSSDRGETWETISPDLTTDDPAKQKQMESGGLTIDNSTAENHTTIYSISESPVDSKVIWVGTDDGNLQVTRDDGATWTNVTGNVPGVPANTWVSYLAASPHEAGTAFATFDGHRTGDMTTYAYRTDDFGQTWTSLVHEGLEGYAQSIRQDTEQPGLVFLGTEMGFWVSIDGGSSWARFAQGIPSRVSVRDLAIQEATSSLAIATHGRGAYILDDLTPLRALTAEALAEDLAILPSKPAVMRLSSNLGGFPGQNEYIALNPPEAASVYYHLPKRHLFGEFVMRVYDAEGEVIQELPAGMRKGINQIVWPMRLKAPKVPPAGSLVPAFEGPRVPEGTYRVELVKGDATYETEIELVADPRIPYPPEDRKLQQETALRLYRDLEELTYVAETLSSLNEAATAKADALGGGQARRLREYAGELESFRKTLVATSPAGWLSGQEELREDLANLYGAVNGFAGRPTNSQLARLDILEAELADAKAEFARITGEPLARANRGLDEPLTVPTREEWEAKRSGAASSDAAAFSRLMGRFRM